VRKLAYFFTFQIFAFAQTQYQLEAQDNQPSLE